MPDVIGPLPCNPSTSAIAPALVICWPRRPLMSMVVTERGGFGRSFSIYLSKCPCGDASVLVRFRFRKFSHRETPGTFCA